MKVSYNPELVLCVVDGLPVEDPADTNDAFAFTLDSDQVNRTVGMYGAGGHEDVLNTNGAFVIKVKAKSDDNTRFSAIYASRRSVAIRYTNKNSNSNFVSSLACKISKPGFGTSGISDADRSWEFSALEAEFSIGGYRDLVVSPQ